MDQLMPLFRKYHTPTSAPLDTVRQLCRDLPESLIKVQQYFWDEFVDQPPAEEEDDDPDDSDDLAKTREEVFLSRIKILDEQVFEAKDQSKRISVEKAAEQCVDFLQRVAEAADRDMIQKLVAYQTMAMTNPLAALHWNLIQDQFIEDDTTDSESTIEEIQDEEPEDEEEDDDEPESPKVEPKPELPENQITDFWTRFLDLYSKIKETTDISEIELLDKLHSIDSNLITISTDDPVPPLKMYSTRIQFLSPGASINNVPFVGKSPFGRDDSRWEAAVKVVEFVDNFLKLLEHFKKMYAVDKEPYKLVVGLIRSDADVIKMMKSGSDLVGRAPRYSTKIELCNVVTVEESGPKSGDLATARIVYYLKKLCKIEQNTTNETAQKEMKPNSVCKSLDSNQKNVLSEDENLKNQMLQDLMSGSLSMTEIMAKYGKLKELPSDSNNNDLNQAVEPVKPVQESKTQKPIIKNIPETSKESINVEKIPESKAIKEEQKKKNPNQNQNSGGDGNGKGIKQKLDGVKEDQFRKKLVVAFQSINPSTKAPLEILEALQLKGIQIGSTKQTKGSHTKVVLKFQDYPSNGSPHFSGESKKKLESKKTAARRLIEYLRDLAKNEPINIIQKEELEDNEQNNNNAESEKNHNLSHNQDNRKDSNGSNNNNQLIELFKSLNLSKKTPLEILDMLKARGEQIEIEQTSVHNQRTQDYSHVTRIQVRGKEFNATASKKIESKRLAAVKAVEHLRSLSNHQEQLKPDESSDQDSDSDDLDHDDQEEEEEAFRNRASSSASDDQEPLWGAYVERRDAAFTKVENLRKARSTFQSMESIAAGPRIPLNSSELERLNRPSNQNAGPVEGPSEERIQEFILLIRRFDKVNSKQKPKLQVLNDLKSQGQQLKIFRTMDKKNNSINGPLVFHVSVNIEGFGYFEETSTDKKFTEARALQKALRFLKNLAHLPKNFLYEYSHTKYPTEIIEKLMVKNFEMLQAHHSEENGCFCTKMIVTNVAEFTGKDKDRLKAKEVAMTKTAHLLMKLAQIQGTLKVKNYINSVIRQETPAPVPKPISRPVQPEPESDLDSFADDEEDEDFTGSYTESEESEKLTFSELIKKNLPTTKEESKKQPKQPEVDQSAELSKMIDLVEKLKLVSSAEVNLSSVDGQWKLLDHLRQQGVQIRVTSDLVGPVNDRKYSLTIEIKDISGATFTAQAQNEDACRVEALAKTVNYLKNLALLVKNYQKATNGTLDEEPEVEVIEKLNPLETMLNIFKSIYDPSNSASMIVGILMEKIRQPTSGLDPQILEVQQMPMYFGPSPQHITTINVGGDEHNFMEVFSGTGTNAAQSLEEAAQKLVFHLSGLLAVQLESQLDLKQLVNDESLIQDSGTSKLVYEAVKEQWVTLTNANPVAQFKMLAALVLVTGSGQAKVLCIGTGSETLPKESLSWKGEAIQDSHAEIVCRRAFHQFLYAQIRELASNSSNPEIVLEPGEHGFCLKKTCRIYLYISSPPCSERKSEFFKSCSDKLAQWNVTGWQGALLGSFIEPVYIDGIVASDLAGFEQLPGKLYDGLDQSLMKAFLESTGLEGRFRLNRHKIGYYRAPIGDGDKCFQASPLQEYPISHNWYRLPNNQQFNPIEIIHTQIGTILGSGLPSRLSKLSIWKQFREITTQYPGLLELTNGADMNKDPVSKATGAELYFDLKPYYRGAKNRNVAHLNAKRAFRDTFVESGMGVWVQAPIHVDLFMIAN